MDDEKDPELDALDQVNWGHELQLIDVSEMLDFFKMPEGLDCDGLNALGWECLSIMQH